MSFSPIKSGKNHPGWAVIIVVVIEIIFAVVIWLAGEWFYAGSVETFGPLNSYVFLWVGIGIASVAATSTFFALLSTRESLELIRGTQRPLLSTANEPYEPAIREYSQENRELTPRITLAIRNWGSLPADRVSIICALSTEDDVDTWKALKHSISRPAPLIYFPGVQIDHTFYIETADFDKCKKGQFTIQVNIKYDCSVSRRTHTTRRYFDYDPFTSDPHEARNLYHKKDYWD
jgi:hypothetical protein